uniref:Uncharacterized protein n=1 Tax=Cajanus cajan TaxID=3821 RepID=A0A151U9H3_CAJCA|nr:hypothetical protein KK1_020165 [Cajanus cajan]
MGPVGREPGVTLGEEHIPIIGDRTVAPQPSDGLPHAILTLAKTQIPATLRHAPHLTRPTNPKVPARTRQPAQHRVPLARTGPNGPRPTLLQHHRLVLQPEKRVVVVLHVAPLQLHRAAARRRAELPGALDGARDAGGALRHGEVAAALVEAVGHVGGAGAHHGEVVVGGVRGRVDQRGEERVEVGLVGRGGGVALLRASAVEEKIHGGGQHGNNKERG